MNTGEIILAPMEGVLDYPLREAITDYNHYDYCVSEFIRISDVIFPGKVFRREVPELKMKEEPETVLLSGYSFSEPFRRHWHRMLWLR